MKKALVLLAALLVATPAAAADKLRYSLTVAGIPLGKVKISVDLGDAAYGVEGKFNMIPILRQILNGDARANVRGVVLDGRYVPRESVFRYEDREGEKRKTIVFDAAGVPIDVVAVPPTRETNYRMTIDEAAGAVDPATAGLILMAPRAQPCALSIDVFDGTKRHLISLRGAQSPAQGKTVTCIGLYERVNGFKAKYMADDRRTWPFAATLTERQGRWIPLKITANTKFGPASATLRR